MTNIFEPDEANFIDIDGLAIRVVKEGDGAPLTPILLTSPYPETVHAFHAIWPRLRETNRPLIAVDLPGFGRSEGRSSLMSPAAMGNFFPRLMGALGLTRVHAVVPDVGTLAALFAGASHPTLFESIVAGSGGVSMSLLGAPLRQIVESSLADFEKQDGGPQVVATVQAGLRNAAPASAIEDYRRGATGQRWNLAAEFVRAYSRDLPLLGRLLPEINVPVLILSGSNDPFVPPANGTFLAERLPRATAVVIDAGHFVWEDAPEIYAEHVIDWINGSYLETAPRDATPKGT